MLNRFAIVLLAGCLALTAATTHAAPLTARIRNTDYVRITEWARWQGLQMRWIKRDETFLLTNAAANMQFEVNSREARFNGLQLWLLHPLVSRGDGIYISQLDIDSTFSPLLAAHKNDDRKKVKII